MGYQKVNIEILNGTLNDVEEKHIKKMLRTNTSISFKGGQSFAISDKTGSTKIFKIGTKKEGKKFPDYRTVKIKYLNE